MMYRRRRWTNWLPRIRVADDVDREIRAHIAMRAAELQREGWDEASATAEATRLFGDQHIVADACRKISTRQHRAERRHNMLQALGQDLRYGARVLKRSPGFTFVAVLTLALGIGANTAVFSVVQGVLLEPLPFERPEELVSIRETTQRGGTMRAAWANFRDWESESRSFDAMTAYGVGATTVLGGDQPSTLMVANVSAGFWRVFPVRPRAGRLTTRDDHLGGAEPVVVVSESVWINRLGQRPLESIVLEVNGARARVVGVAPPEFSHPGGAEVWAPMEPIAGTSTSRSSHNWLVEARLADGVSMEQARQEIDALTRVLVAGETDEDPEYLAAGAAVRPLRDEIVGDTGSLLWMLLGAAGLVLIVACTNLASTMLARGTGRMREFAVRSSLGAGRTRIVRQLIAESALLALIGAAAGVFLATIILQTVRTATLDIVPRIGTVGLNGTVLLYAGLIALVAVCIFGLVPTAALLRGDPGHILRGAGRGNTVDHRARIWRLLIGVEVALSLVLLAGSGLLVRSFQTLLSQDRGFDATDVAVSTLTLSRLKYETPADHGRLLSELVVATEALPGVASAGILSLLPVNGGAPNGRIELDGDMSNEADAEYIVASGGAFRALNIPLITGRLFDVTDTPENGHVAIVNEAFVRQYWPNDDPIGRQVTGGGMDNFWEERPFARVVGVVGDVPFTTLADPPVPTVFFPHTQRPFRLQFAAQLVVEAAGTDAGPIIPAMRSTISTLDPDIPIQITPLEQRVRGSVSDRRLTMSLLGGFSLIALALAAVGIYGVVSYTVARRRREMGIRIALGATPTTVRRMVVASSMRLVIGGLVVGLLVALGAVRVLTSLLFGVSAADPVTFASVLLLIVSTALVASWLPAFLGTRVDPTITMRAE